MSSTLIGVEMYKSKQSVADAAATSEVVARYQNPDTGLHEGSALRRWDSASVREGDRLELCPLTTSSTVLRPRNEAAVPRASACPPGCRVCFLAQKYGLTPREVAMIALISSGKSGRAISQTLGIEMPTIRQYCGRIHGKIGTHSRLAIGLWAIRKGMVKSVVQT
jgi:DNA-binding CsgD family transcriptional regulator